MNNFGIGFLDKVDYFERKRDDIIHCMELFHMEIKGVQNSNFDGNEKMDDLKQVKILQNVVVFDKQIRDKVIDDIQNHFLIKVVEKDEKNKGVGNIDEVILRDIIILINNNLKEV